MLVILMSFNYLYFLPEIIITLLLNYWTKCACLRACVRACLCVCVCVHIHIQYRSKVSDHLLKIFA